jgi:hypothetical protein
MGPFGGSFLSVVADGTQVLAGARNGQLFRSTNQGRNWTQVSFGRHLSGNVQVLAVPSPQHYFAGIGGEHGPSNGIWESTDGGASWTQTLNGLAVESLAVRGSVIAAGTRQGLYLRRDAMPWTRITPQNHADLIDIVAVAIDPVDTRIVYAGTPHLPWKTADGGATWTSIHTGLIDDSDVFSLHISRRDPTRVYASACSGIYRTLDAAAHWKMLDGIPNGSRRTHIITEDPTDARLVYAGTTAGLFRSEDAGESWQKVQEFQANALAFDGPRLYAATEHAGVQVSIDQGKTFQAVNNGLHARSAAAATINGSLVYAATAYEGVDGGVFVASGTGWRRLAAPTSFGDANVHTLATDGKRIYAATEEITYQSGDGGRTWAKWRASAGILTIEGLAGEVWTGTRTALLRGAVPVAGVNGPVHAIRAAGKYLLARGTDSVYLESGRGWRRVAAPSLFDAAVSCDGAALLATSSQLLVLSTPMAAPRAAEGIPSGTVSAVAFHPLSCREAYAVQFGRTYISHDAGAHWAALDVGQPLPSASRIWTTTADPTSLFAIVPGAGLWRRSLPLPQ